MVLFVKNKPFFFLGGGLKLDKYLWQ